ncbi:hypothetical protein NEUTE1DRAFT_144278 [Neurospora tetrasperma FGSC 2508]|uniref:Uncharacterized protein n=1 Tax=Neurospora tetrasperma (strain FGSC 2508 / ATCC MYA-4615 / P0657) TaxID=510951 RepID=F8MAN2_NEUT8|nr:uncharacterized protein NEUTE1DRAFT_144278 [Neurospora tetrasperma FGSC 2508]EGO60955.1 hypothetical protein NEUTE1DRAFT_144278 [Neurospora tetrasperma FGSC 2508]EGZ75041.1 ankyrin [Neurospora tetrasperma FGSC 2509]
MAPQLNEEEIDDLIYFARAGEKDDLTTTLTELAEREKVSVAEILASAKDEGKSTCLHMAAGNGHLDIVTLILSEFTSRPKEEKQAYLDAANEYGNTGLHWAALGGHLDVIKLLMAAGASPALANDKNYVPLDLASFGEKHDVVDYFLEQAGGLEDKNTAEGLKAAAEGLKVDDDGNVEFKMSVGDTSEASGSGSAQK